MLFGRNSARSNFILPAPSGDFSCALNAGDGNTLAIAAVPKLSNHRLRFSLFNSSSRSFHLMERAEFLFEQVGLFLIFFCIVYFRSPESHKFIDNSNPRQAEAQGMAMSRRFTEPKFFKNESGRWESRLA